MTFYTIGHMTFSTVSKITLGRMTFSTIIKMTLGRMTFSTIVQMILPYLAEWQSMMTPQNDPYQNAP